MPLLLLLLQAALVGAVACLSSMIGYCIYSVLYPQLQQRRIDAARRKRFRMVAVQVRLMVVVTVVVFAAGIVLQQPTMITAAQCMQTATHTVVPASFISFWCTFSAHGSWCKTRPICDELATPSSTLCTPSLRCNIHLPCRRWRCAAVSATAALLTGGAGWTL
jgi:hypothetical protein